MKRRVLSSRYRWLSFLILFALAASLVSACGQTGQVATAGMNMSPLSSMPADVQNAPASVQQAYQFAAANPDLLQQVPCYCGCGAMGHTNNYDCYVSGQNAGGSLSFDSHALGCSICVDITQDAMRLSQQGKTGLEIRAFIDGAYAQYGPSNMQ